MANIVDLMGQPFTPQQPKQPDPPELQFRQAMIDAGMTPPDYIDADGQLHRYSTNGKSHDKAGWYILYGGKVPAGCFGDWRIGSSVPFRADIGRDLTAAESIEHSRRMAEMKAIRERELAEKRADAAETAAEIWAAASQASDDHPYLVRKQISANGLKVAGDGRLIAPLLIAGEIVSLQYIAADGQKLFLKGGRTAGASWLIGDHGGASTYYLAEGVATGITIFETTGEPVAIAYSASNMTATAKALREYVGNQARIVIVSDNDTSGTGQSEGKKAADAIGAELVIPPETGHDANDFAIAGGDLSGLLNPAPVESGYLIPADDFSREPAPIKWLIKHHLQRDALIMVHGPSGGGKTFVVLDMVLSIASGKADWCGNVVRPGPVVYLAGEGHHGLRGRIAAWKQHNSVNSLNMWLSKAGEDLNTPAGYLHVQQAIKALPYPPSAIVVDTLHRFLAGDENSAQDAKTMLDACSGLMREFGSSVVLVHHTGVADEAQHRARGSSAWRGALDIEISVVPGKDGAPLEIIQRKSKDAELAEPVYMTITPVPLPWQDEDGEPVTSAVVVQADTPEEKQDGPKVPGTARQLFESAWFALGDIDQGRPYLTASAWNEYTKSRDFPTDGARRKALQRAKNDLTSCGYLEEYKAGYIVADSMAAMVLCLSMAVK